MFYGLQIALYYDKFTIGLNWIPLTGYRLHAVVYVAFFGLEKFKTAQPNAMFFPQFIMSIKSGFQVFEKCLVFEKCAKLVYYKKA